MPKKYRKIIESLLDQNQETTEQYKFSGTSGLDKKSNRWSRPSQHFDSLQKFYKKDFPLQIIYDDHHSAETYEYPSFIKRKENSNEITILVGEYVKCIESEGTELLEKGQLYKVKKSYLSKEGNGAMVVVEEVKGKAFNSNRFEKLSVEDDDSQFEDDFEE